MPFSSSGLSRGRKSNCINYNNVMLDTSINNHVIARFSQENRGNPFAPVIASVAKQSSVYTSLRGAKRRGNPFSPRHCETFRSWQSSIYIPKWIFFNLVCKIPAKFSKKIPLIHTNLFYCKTVCIFNRIQPVNQKQIHTKLYFFNFGMQIIKKYSIKTQKHTYQIEIISFGMHSTQKK